LSFFTNESFQGAPERAKKASAVESALAQGEKGQMSEGPRKEAFWIILAHDFLHETLLSRFPILTALPRFRFLSPFFRFLAPPVVVSSAVF
jgi:hypothetical protein